MWKKKIVHIFAGTLLVVLPTLFSTPVPSAQAGSVSSDRYALQGSWRNPARSVSLVNEETPRHATDHILVKRVGGQVERVAVLANISVEETVLKWRRQADVEYAEPDGLYHVMAQDSTWGWETVKASAAASTNGATGSGIVVAVVDTGVDYEHEDLDANNWINTAETKDNNIDDDANGYVDDYYGYDFIGSSSTAVTPDKDPQDEMGHGTHVAGIIAAENNTVGIRGIASSAQIMPVKVLDSYGYGYDSTIADGIRYAVNKGADIINLSLGSAFASNTLKAAIDFAETNGVLVIAASGNESTFSAPSYPAAYSYVVSVGATNEDGYKAEFSNWGKVDVMAPGVDILSSVPGNLYEQYSGTSMAAPHVSGVAALVMHKFNTTDARKVRHILEVTADDFGPMAGPDYMSGYGMVNALDATGTQTARAFVSSDSNYLISDDSSDALLTVSLRDASNNAIANETITWTATRGWLSDVTTTTNSSGQASVTMRADDTYGLATVTADPSNYEAASLQLAIVSDVPRVESVGVSPYTTSTDELAPDEDTGEDEVIIEEPVVGGIAKAKKQGAQPNEAIIPEEITGTGELSYNYYQPGDDIVIWGYPTAYDREAHDIVMSYSVTGPNGKAVDTLAGTTAEVEVGQAFWYWYFPQGSFQSTPLTIPTDAKTGQYTVTVTLTEQATAETSTAHSTFWVGELPEILVLDNDGYCYDTAIEGLDFGYVSFCTSGGQKIVDALDTAGYNSLLWNVTMHGLPTSEDLLLFPLVVAMDATYAVADVYTLQSYLDAGGSLLISSEQLAYYNNTSYYSGAALPSEFLWNYMHAAYGGSVIQPDSVVGVSGSDFAGTRYDVNTYNIEGNGTHTAAVADELLLNDDGTAEAIFAHTQGDTTDKIAGIQVEADNYRVVYLSFGIETINDAGDATKANLLDALVSWLLRAKPTIQKVNPKTLSNNDDRTITMYGKHFQIAGTTQVKLGNRLLDNVVVKSSTKITATVPAGLNPQQYSLTIIRPDGKKVTRAKAVRILQGGPRIESFSQSFVSNDRVRELQIVGNTFRSNSQVWFGSTHMTQVTFDGPTQLTVKIPKDFAPGHYAITVKTGATAKAKRVSAIVVRVGFTTELRNGSVDDQVIALERRLAKYNYFTDEPNRTFDNATEEALARYQHDQGIRQTGTTDALTRYYLNTNE